VAVAELRTAQVLTEDQVVAAVPVGQAEPERPARETAVVQGIIASTRMAAAAAAAQAQQEQAVVL